LYNGYLDQIELINFECHPDLQFFSQFTLPDLDHWRYAGHPKHDLYHVPVLLFAFFLENYTTFSRYVKAIGTCEKTTY
jgi:hypothetical protein